MRKKGQSIVELILIVILVILGIYFMGAYVLRSVNAHYKLWDEGIQDSFDEHLAQAPANDVPPINTDCQCTIVNGACGTGLAGSCATNQREQDFDCTILGCNGAPGGSTCIDDPSCCSAGTALGCGTFPLPKNPDGSVNTSPPESPPAAPPAANNCYFGQDIQLQACGSGSGQITCTTDSICPPPKCTGATPTGSAIACPGEPPTSGPVDNNYAITYVPLETNCNGPCQYYCNDGYTYNATNKDCEIASTPIPYCDWFCNNPTSNPFSETWNGEYQDSSGSSSDDISITCSGGVLQGFCAEGTVLKRGAGPTGSGLGPPAMWPTCAGGVPSGSLFAFLASSPSYLFYEQTTPKHSFTFNGDVLTQVLQSMVSNDPLDSPPGPNDQCNWTGKKYIEDFGAGYDFYVDCENSGSPLNENYIAGVLIAPNGSYPGITYTNHNDNNGCNP